MLLKLTCPSCGRVEQASERVLGKEIRCPCGTQFRVLQPKEAAPDRGSPEARRQPGGRQFERRPLARARRDRSHRSIAKFARRASNLGRGPGFPWSRSTSRNGRLRGSKRHGKERGHASLGLRGRRRRRGDVAVFS